MIAFPAATGGAGRFSTQLMEITAPRMVCKGGAEGLECVGIVEEGLGIAIKSEDGASRPLAPAMLALLDHLGLLKVTADPALEALARPVMRNAAGLEVGVIEAELKIAAPAAL
jgi:L-asparaginase II